MNRFLPSSFANFLQVTQKYLQFNEFILIVEIISNNELSIAEFKNNVERIISKWIAEFKNFETKDIITI